MKIRRIDVTVDLDPEDQFRMAPRLRQVAEILVTRIEVTWPTDTASRASVVVIGRAMKKNGEPGAVFIRNRWPASIHPEWPFPLKYRVAEILDRLEAL